MTVAAMASARTDYQFRVLGPLEAEACGTPVNLGFRRQRLILGLLLLENRRLVPTARLIDLAWFGQAPPETARNGIQVSISQLRSALQDVATFNAAGSGYRIDVEPDALDLHRFRTCLMAAREASGAERVALFRAAEREWRGQVLAGELSAELRLMLCAGLQEERIAAIEDRIATELQLGLHRQAAAELTGLIGLHPARERLAGYLMTALYRDGQSAAALEVARRTRAVLSAELGIEPGPELRDLELAILRQEPRLKSPAVSVARTEVPAHLPPDTHGFIGRQQQISQLDQILASQAQQPTAVSIAVLSGTAGVGKTTLAVHWAHEVASRFPDGQLYADLHGFSPELPPARPADVLRRFLMALGATQEGIPADLDGQAALYRSRIAGRRILILLDNARDEAQVRPLIPGSCTCAVVVTSRMRLYGLVATTGAQPIALDVLSEQEAVLLLSRRVGLVRAEREPAAVIRIVRCCAYLPLALAIVAARVVMEADLTLTTAADQLNSASGSLQEFAVSDEASDVRAALSWSYAALSEPAARMFRLLGNHPGPQLSATVAASIAGLGLGETQELLRELLQASMISERGLGSYFLHDLLTAYAAEVHRESDTEHDMQAACARMVDYYLQATRHATQVLYPRRQAIMEAVGLPGTVVVEARCQAEALSWLRSEHPVLVHIVRRAYDLALDEQAWLLAWLLKDYLHWQGLLADWLAVQTVALESAERLGNTWMRAVAYRSQGRVLAHMGEHSQAHARLKQAIGLFRQLSDRSGQAGVHQVRADLYDLQERFAEAVAELEQAKGLYEATGEVSLRAATLNNLAWSYAKLGDHETALRYGRDAIVANAGVGDRNLEAAVLDTMGFVYMQLGDLTAAMIHYRRSLGLQRVIGQRMVEAQTLISIGDCHRAGGEMSLALNCWRNAQEILEELSHPLAREAQARIEQASAAALA